MTEKLFYNDSSLYSFTARVMSCEPNGKGFAVVLDRTAFYPEGGGQPADKGTLSGIEVTDVREKGAEVLHITATPIEAGTEVTGMVNGEYRLDLCQQHTGEHIVSGIIHKLYGYDNVGFHMGSDVVTIDLSGELTPENLVEIERLANGAVYMNIPVKVEHPSPQELERLHYRSKKKLEGSVRIVEIEGFDLCACCGTHTKTTGQVGAIKLLTAQKYKGGTRVSMLCGRAAMEDYAAKNNAVYEISALLSAKVGQVTAAVERLLSENESLKSKLSQLMDRQLADIADSMQSDGKMTIAVVEELSPNDLRKLCLMLCEKAEIAAAISGDDKQGYKYAIGSNTVNVSTNIKQLNAALAGRGGGTPELVQGSFAATAKEIQDVLGAAEWS